GKCSSPSPSLPRQPPYARPIRESYRPVRGNAVKTNRTRSLSCLFLPTAALLAACSSKPPPEPLRMVRTAEVRYDDTQQTDRYFGSIQARYEVDQAFRVGGKVVSRKVDVGQKVRQGDIIAVLDDTDYKLAVGAAQQQLAAAEAQARQAQSDRQ